MSYQRTNDLIRILSEDHDVEVEFWKDELLKLLHSSISVRQNLAQYYSYQLNLCMQGRGTVDLKSPVMMVVDDGDSDEEDCHAPPYSPISVDGNFQDDCEVEADKEDESDAESNTDDQMFTTCTASAFGVEPALALLGRVTF